MVRIAAILLAFLVCTFAGAGTAARLTRRYRTLRDIQTAGDRVFDRISATREPLDTVLAGENGVFGAYADALAGGMSERAALAAALAKSGAALTDADRAAAAELLGAFRATSVGQLASRYTKAAARLSACVGEADDDQRGKAKLYRAMGVLFGAALAILLW